MTKFTLGVLLLVISNTSSASTILLETFTRANSVYSASGWGLRSQDGYLGIKFSVDNTIYIENIIANLGGIGDYFTGIVQLSDSASAPVIAPGFDPDSLLFYTSQPFRSNSSSDTSTQVSMLLAQGSYAVIFGGVGDSFGVMPGTTVLGNSTIPLTDYIEYRSEENGWVEFDYSGIRVVLEGELNPVPLPASFYLFLSGLMLLSLKIKRSIK